MGALPSSPTGSAATSSTSLREDSRAGPALGTTTLPPRRQWRVYLLQSRAWPRSESAQLKSVQTAACSTSPDHGLVARRTDAESSESVLATSESVRTAGIPSRAGCPSLVRVSSESTIICGPQRVVCWAAGPRACDDPSPDGAAPRNPSRTRIGNLSPGSLVQPVRSRLGLSQRARGPIADSDSEVV
jgi:hypothetical protein